MVKSGWYWCRWVFFFPAAFIAAFLVYLLTMGVVVALLDDQNMAYAVGGPVRSFLLVMLCTLIVPEKKRAVYFSVNGAIALYYVLMVAFFALGSVAAFMDPSTSAEWAYAAGSTLVWGVVIAITSVAGGWAAVWPGLTWRAKF